MSSEELESLLKNGSDESSFQCLQRFLFLSRFFFFDLVSDKDVFDEESDDDCSGSGFTSCLCLSLFFELSVDRVSGFSCNGVTKSGCRVSEFFSVSRSKTSLVSSSVFLI